MGLDPKATNYLPGSPIVPQSEEPKRGDGSGQTRKYGNRKVEARGHKFDSAKEAARYEVLRLLLAGGQIVDLGVHPTYAFVIDGYLICTYTPDFRYREAGSHIVIVEDVKSYATRKKDVYRIKKKLMQALYHIEVKEL